MARSIDPEPEDRQRVTVYLGAEEVAWLDMTRDLIHRDRSRTMRDLIRRYGASLTRSYQEAADALADRPSQPIP